MPEETQPFYDGEGGNESVHHVRLKNTAVYWLLSQGFDHDQIQEEFAWDRYRLDIVAIQEDGTILNVEVERNETVQRLARRRQSLLREGHQVFALTESGLFELRGRNGDARPIDVQLTLSEFDNPRYGRWFSNGRKADVLFTNDLNRRYGTDPRDSANEDPRGPRWAANGNNKPDMMIWELDPDKIGDMF